MLKIRLLVKRSLFAVTLLALVGVVNSSVAAAPADTASGTTETNASGTSTEPPADPSPVSPAEQSSPPPASGIGQEQSAQNTGPKKPTGADAKTYHYNEATGMWENDYYIWDPVTHQTTPKSPQTYSYNPTTGMWDTTEWRYNAAAGHYEENTVSQKQKPEGAVQTNNTSNVDQTESWAANNLNENAAASATTSGQSATSNHAFDQFYNASISNTINSEAQTGNASIEHNTVAGSAITGTATVMANVINLLQSSWSPLGGDLVTFVADIIGDVFGDMFIDPGEIFQSQNNNNNTDYPGNTNFEINSEQNTHINNDIYLGASSGDATVDGNTTAGDAITGDAHAVANVVNMINSIIASGQSFLGIVNIEGNFNGDILVPQEVLNSLFANSAPIATLDTSQIENNELIAELNNNQTIDNQVTTTAVSGDATVAGNTTAGDAQTGDTSTNVTILNLTGQEVIGSNALLVFVNVLGNWVGAIVNAPEGSTSAALGNGNAQNTVPIATSTAQISNDNNSQINNSISVAAATGDASVTNNTSAGNAQTGDASASVNLLNILNSSFSLSDWFGILFINVFGTWNGSFGIDTPAGNSPAAPAVSAVDTSNPNSVQVFRFIPANNDSKKVRLAGVPLSEYSNGSESEILEDAVLAATTSSDSNKGSGNAQNGAQKSSSTGDWIITSVIAGTMLLGLERLMAFLRHRRLSSV